MKPKLLKEKGFNEICYLGYNKNGEYVPTNNRTNSQIIQPDFCFICCPTLQMAMKWLREIHDIFIVIEPHMYNYINEKNSSYVTSLWQGDNYYENITSKDYPTYEEAVETTLKYCLEKLI